MSNVHKNKAILVYNNQELNEILDTWSRDEIIQWLCWNDPNGVYTDADSLNEFGNIMTKEEGIEIMVRQINENRVE